jgi:hypothetical protein
VLPPRPDLGEVFAVFRAAAPFLGKSPNCRETRQSERYAPPQMFYLGNRSLDPDTRHDRYLGSCKTFYATVTIVCLVALVAVLIWAR